MSNNSYTCNGRENLMWFITLLVLALAAFFIVKTVKAKAKNQEANQEQIPQTTEVSGGLNRGQTEPSSSDSRSENSNVGVESATDSVKAGSVAAVAAVSAAAVVTTGAAKGAINAATSAVSASSLDLNTGDVGHDVREMIKILNLADADAGRLAITKDEFSAIRQGNGSDMPAESVLSSVADRLRHMLA